MTLCSGHCADVNAETLFLTEIPRQMRCEVSAFLPWPGVTRGGRRVGVGGWVGLAESAVDVVGGSRVLGVFEHRVGGAVFDDITGFALAG